MEAIEMFADSGTRDLDFAAAIEPDQKSGWAWVLFFAQSMHFKLALAQAAWLRFFEENQLCCTSTRDLIKDALLIEQSREEKSPTTGGI